MSVATPRRVVVIGYGSPLRSDDAVGRRIVEKIVADRAAIDVVSAHQLDFDMADALRHHDAAIFVDASVDGLPGTLHCRRVEGCFSDEGIAHHLTPESLLALVAQLWGRAPEAWAVTLTGKSFVLGESLTPAIEARVPLIAAMLEAIGSAMARA